MGVTQVTVQGSALQYLCIKFDTHEESIVRIADFFLVSTLTRTRHPYPHIGRRMGGGPQKQ